MQLPFLHHCFKNILRKLEKEVMCLFGRSLENQQYALSAKVLQTSASYCPHEQYWIQPTTRWNLWHDGWLNHRGHKRSENNHIYHSGHDKSWGNLGCLRSQWDKNAWQSEHLTFYNPYLAWYIWNNHGMNPILNWKSYPKIYDCLSSSTHNQSQQILWDTRVPFNGVAMWKEKYVS